MVSSTDRLKIWADLESGGILGGGEVGVSGLLGCDFTFSVPGPPTCWANTIPLTISPDCFFKFYLDMISLCSPCWSNLWSSCLSLQRSLDYRCALQGGMPLKVHLSSDPFQFFAFCLNISSFPPLYPSSMMFLAYRSQVGSWLWAENSETVSHNKSFLL
jgi:hypothetical protein